MSAVPGTPTGSSPPTLSASVGVAAILGACFAGSTGPIQSAPLLLEAGGLTLFATGVVLRRRSRRLIGSVLTLSGFVTVASALVGVVALSPPPLTLIAVLSCGFGALVVTHSAFPIYARSSRSSVIVGIALVFGGVIANTVVGDSPFWRSTAAVTMVFLSWDVSERAITLGKQVGSDCETVSVEIVRTAASTLVAVLAVVSTVAVSRVPVDHPSLVGLALLLVATVAFVLALSHVPQVPKPPR